MTHSTPSRPQATPPHAVAVLSSICYEPLTLRLRLRDRAFLIASGALSARLESKLTFDAEQVGGWFYFDCGEDDADTILSACDRLGIRAHLESEEVD